MVHGDFTSDVSFFTLVEGSVHVSLFSNPALYRILSGCLLWNVSNWSLTPLNDIELNMVKIWANVLNSPLVVNSATQNNKNLMISDLLSPTVTRGENVSAREWSPDVKILALSFLLPCQTQGVRLVQTDRRIETNTRLERRRKSNLQTNYQHKQLCQCEYCYLHPLAWSSHSAANRANRDSVVWRKWPLELFSDRTRLLCRRK